MNRTSPGTDGANRPTERRVNLKALADQELMVLLKQGLSADAGGPRPDVFRELVDRYKDRVFNYICRYVGQRATAEDLTQETFVRVFRNLASYDPQAKFSTWIYTIATNLAKDEFKRRARHPARSLDWSSGEGSDTTRDLPGGSGNTSREPAVVAERQELRDQIQTALHQMKEEDREILILREVQQMPYEEIAQILGVPMGTVKSRISRARAAFTEVWRRFQADLGAGKGGS
jgi:RNA polymerase sigma-70 factor (ECF subfamily)